jgi:hypothetical protein
MTVYLISRCPEGIDGSPTKMFKPERTDDEPPRSQPHEREDHPKGPVQTQRTSATQEDQCTGDSGEKRTIFTQTL